MRLERDQPGYGFCLKVLVLILFFGVGYDLTMVSGPGHDKLPGETGRPAASRHVVKKPQEEIKPRLMHALDVHPLSFEANQGQSDGRVKFLSRGNGYALFLTENETVLELAGSKPLGGITNSLTQATEMQPALEQGHRSGKGASKNPQATVNGPQSKNSVMRMRLLNASPSARIIGVDALPGKTNYFIGNDPAQWRTHVPNFSKVLYKNIYPGVDLVYYGNQGQLEYDFVVAAGADPRAIEFAIGESGWEGTAEANGSQARGAYGARLWAAGDERFKNQNPKFELKNSVRLARYGDLEIAAGVGGEVRFHKPVVYQEQSTVDSSQLTVQNENRNSKFESHHSSLVTRHFLDGRYVLSARNRIGFEVGNYDRSKPLIIDPVLTYSTYLGGGGDDIGNAIAVDSAGNAYVTGTTLSTNFPLASPFQSVCRGCGSRNTNIFVTKINAAGSALVYSTYLGGNSADSATAIAVDSSGNAYLTGTASSINFPVSATPFQASCSSCLFGSPDAFVTKLSADGSALVYSTYLGGLRTDQASSIAVDSSGSAYVSGATLSDDFPKASPLQSTCSGCALGFSDAFVTKFDPTGSVLVYSTYLGGSNSDVALAIAVDSSSNAYVAGRTQSNDFPTVGAFQPFFGGGTDGFVAKINPAGSALVFSTYLGGSGNDDARGIAVDSSGNAFVTGFTISAGFPTANPIQAAEGGNQDAYVLKLDHTGSTLDYSTFLGGFNNDGGSGIAVDAAGNAYVTGLTSSSNFPVANPTQSALVGNQDAFVTKINSAGSAIIFSTYLGGHAVSGGGGIAIDSAGNVYVTGQTNSNDFPTASPIQAATGGGFDVFVSKLSSLASPAIGLSPTSLTFAKQPVGSTSAAQAITVTNNGDAALTVTAVATTGDFAETDTCSAAVPAGGTCTVNVTFKPTAQGPRTGTVAFTDNAFASPQTINLSGAATIPAVTLSNSGMNFGNQGVTTASAAQTLTLTNPGTAPLNISSVVVGAGFAQTNTCGSSVAPGANCTFSVTFTPTALGGVNASLTLNDDAPGSPQTVALSGNGVVAYSLSATATSQSVDKGTDTATFTLSAASTFGFTDAITLACANNPPTNCAFSPASISAGQTSTLTVSNITALGVDTLNFVVTGTSGTQTATQNLAVLIHDFTVIVAPNTQAVTAGQTATYTVSMTPINSFNQTVKLTCVGAPVTITCTLNPTSVTLTGSSTSTAAMTVTTVVRPSSSFGGGSHVNPFSPFGLSVDMRRGVWLLGFAMLLVTAATRRRKARLSLALMMLFVLSWGACSVGSNIPNGTPAGTYAIQVTGAGPGTLQHTQTFGLTVN